VLPEVVAAVEGRERERGEVKRENGRKPGVAALGTLGELRSDKP
jgi:hypothetical protein